MLYFIVVLFSAVLHEIAHGYVADKLGDPTAKLLGRLTLNPLKHLDPFMSILLPLILLISHLPVIAAAKPVPVDQFNLREGRKDMAIVALSGPLTNLTLALIATIIIKLGFNLLDNALLNILTIILVANLILFIFNLLPIPPLDGSKVFSLLLPEKEANQYLSFGNIGFLIIFILLAFPVAGFSLNGIISNLLNFTINLLQIPYLPLNY